MSAVPSVENPPAPPPRSRARRAPRVPKDESADGQEENDESGDKEDVAALHRTLAERDERIAQLEAQLENVTSSRDDMVERSTDWLSEREELRSQTQELTAKADAERERADAAEERVRELRRTAEESRRAIMRLSSKKPDTPREETERHTRRASVASTLTGRALSSLSFEDHDEKPPLRGLRLSSGSSVTSPTPQQVETMQKDGALEDAAPIKTPEPQQEGFEDAKEEPAEEGEGAGGSTLTGLFGKTSLLRPAFLMRKPAPGEAAPEGEEGAPESINKADLDKAHADLAELRTQFTMLQDQLTESKEAEQASEQLIRSLREYIVNSQGGNLVKDGELDGDVGAQTVAESVAQTEESGKAGVLEDKLAVDEKAEAEEAQEDAEKAEAETTV